MRWSFFFLYGTPTTEISTLSLHDALPICDGDQQFLPRQRVSDLLQHGLDDLRLHRHDDDVHVADQLRVVGDRSRADRKSTRLNSSHITISYAVFCLKKKKKSNIQYAV